MHPSLPDLHLNILTVSHSHVTESFLFYYLPKKFDKAWMTVWLVILFLKSTFVELLEAKCTHKVLRMKFTVHGSDASACDWLLTTEAQRASAGMIVHLAIRSAFMLKETSTRKSLMAFLRGKEKS